MNNFKYPWPASALGAEEMAMPHSVRESSAPRVPITRLIVNAIRAAYANPGGPYPHQHIKGEHEHST